MDTTIIPFLDAQGKPRQYIAIRADITEHKRIEMIMDCTALNFRILKPLAGSLVALGLLTLGIGQARAGVAYGTINNFDAVNDTGVECHGFEIEDLHSADITYNLQ